MNTFDERDEFKRKSIASKIIAILCSDADLPTIVIDGPWGSGKSEFCKKLLALAAKDQPNLSCVYVDAFKFDHADDPLAMLVGSVASLIKDETEKREFIKRAIPLAKVIGKVAGKALVGWALNTNADDLGEDLSDALKEGSKEAIDEGIKDAFSNFEKADESIRAFKEILAKISSNTRLVIVIDELDRCRPNFALSVVEKIKHVFDVKNVRFVLSTNSRQLSAMVKKQYGSEIDADSYLSKFFSYVVNLSQEHSSNGHDYEQNSFRLFYDLVQKGGVLNKHFALGSSIANTFKLLFQMHGRSLRDAEMFYRNLNVYNVFAGPRAIKDNTLWGYVLLYSLGVYIHTFDSILAQKIAQSTLMKEDLGIFFQTSIDSVRTGPDRSFTKIVYFLFINEICGEEIRAMLSQEISMTWQATIAHFFAQGSDPGPGRRLIIPRDAIRVMQML